MTLKQLKTFNQFRTFHKPFAQLGAGDEIDVPARTSLQHDDSAAVNSQPAQTALVTDSRGGAFFKDNTSFDNNPAENAHSFGSATGMVRSMASGAANTAISNWLSKYGTVRAGLNLDTRNSLANSSLDWLVPLYDTPHDTLFTQLGARNKDGRNTINIGWGVRWMTSRWMYGFNNFYDNDMTGNNRRVGLGAEARTDYLQLAANTYMRMSNWHQSRDFNDYDERPASGFDIRTQGWLPAYPQLGGKLAFEQYYGDEVALFGKDSRQRNPYAVTAGLN